MKGRRVRMKKLTRVALALFLLCCASWATATRTTIATAVAQKVAVREAPAQKATFPEAWRAALERISADSMRGHLSFLSSDLLEGRKTPSRGLDLAAEYIAAQFRRAGLEPAGDDGYFQTANWSLASRDMSGFELSLAGGGSALSVSPARSSRLVGPDWSEDESPLGPEPTARLVIVRGAEAARVFDSLPAGVGPATVTFRAPAIVQTPVRVRNVAAVLRGSDPALR